MTRNGFRHRSLCERARRRHQPHRATAKEAAETKMRSQTTDALHTAITVLLRKRPQKTSDQQGRKGWEDQTPGDSDAPCRERDLRSNQQARDENEVAQRTKPGSAQGGQLKPTWLIRGKMNRTLTTYVFTKSKRNHRSIEPR